jgi:hypothetical protein
MEFYTHIFGSDHKIFHRLISTLLNNMEFAKDFIIGDSHSSIFVIILSNNVNMEYGTHNDMLFAIYRKS